MLILANSPVVLKIGFFETLYHKAYLNIYVCVCVLCVGLEYSRQ